MATLHSRCYLVLPFMVMMLLMLRAFADISTGRKTWKHGNGDKGLKRKFKFFWMGWSATTWSYSRVASPAPTRVWPQGGGKARWKCNSCTYAPHWWPQCVKSSHKNNTSLYNPGHYIIMYTIVNTNTKLLLCAAKVYAHMLWIYLHLCLSHASAHAGFCLCSVRLFVLLGP